MKQSCLGAILYIGIFLVISYLITCGIIYLITLCFGWTFKWSIATGIWLVMWLLGSVFKSSSK